MPPKPKIEVPGNSNTGSTNWFEKVWLDEEIKENNGYEVVTSEMKQ